MRLYKFYDANSAIRNLNDKRLKISTLIDINDPFEWLPYDIVTRKDRAIWERTRQEFWQSRGVICFSEDYLSPVTWSHYADSHRGLALGFDINDALLTKIEYVDKKPIIRNLEGYFSGSGEEIIYKALRYKFKHWEYENEWRVFCHLRETDESNGLYFKEFDDDLVLREVVIGANSTITTKKLRRIIGEKVDVTTTRLGFRRFEIVRQNRRDLQK